MAAPDLDALLSKTLAAAESGDWKLFRSMFADDAVLHQNVGREEPIDDAMKMLPLLTADGTTLRYENIRRVHGASSITEMHDAVFTKPDGREVRIDICVVAQYNDQGLISRIDEYMDSASVKALFA